MLGEEGAEAPTKRPEETAADFGGACCVIGGLWFATTRAAIEREIAPVYARA